MSDTAPKGITLDAIIEAWIRHDYNYSQAALEVGCDRSNVLRRLQHAVRAGDERVDPQRLLPQNNQAPLAREIIDAQIELGMRNDRKRAKGDWRKPSYIPNLNGPILLGIFGDPHLDNSGSDLELFEAELSRRSPESGIYTCCVGDFFDNWPRALGHLYQESGDPSPAWKIFEHHWMEHWPFLFSVSGNHDQFSSGTENFLDGFMRRRGSLLRRSGGRFILDMGTLEPIVVSMRHIWRGASQYSEAHGLKRAATFGHSDDDLIVGGHIHQGELRTHIVPHNGRVQKLVQVSSFKKLDNYANDKGFMSPETPPVVWCVLDAREPKTSHLRVQSFYDFNTARAVQEHQRTRNAPSEHSDG